MARYQSRHRSDQEWFEIITRCRQSGLSDAQWCDINCIPRSTFETAAKRLRKKSYAVPPKNATNIVNPLDVIPKQEVVQIGIDRDQEVYNPDVSGTSAAVTNTAASHLDNSHTIELCIGNTTLKISNNADPGLLMMVMHSLGGITHAS